MKIQIKVENTEAAIDFLELEEFEVERETTLQVDLVQVDGNVLTITLEKLAGPFASKLAAAAEIVANLRALDTVGEVVDLEAEREQIARAKVLAKKEAELDARLAARGETRADWEAAVARMIADLKGESS